METIYEEETNKNLFDIICDFFCYNNDEENYKEDYDEEDYDEEEYSEEDYDTEEEPSILSCFFD